MVRCETSEILQIFVCFILKSQPTIGIANGNRRKPDLKLKNTRVGRQRLNNTYQLNRTKRKHISYNKCKLFKGILIIFTSRPSSTISRIPAYSVVILPILNVYYFV